jgi:hypothetical protein
MTVFSVADAKENLDKLIEQVMSDAEPAVVRTETGDEVVLLPEMNSIHGTRRSTYCRVLRTLHVSASR